MRKEAGITVLWPGVDLASMVRREISAKFDSEVSLRVHYCKRNEACFATLLWQTNGPQNSLISWMLFSELHKIMVNKVSFVRFRGAIANPLGSAPDVDTNTHCLYLGYTYNGFFKLVSGSIPTDSVVILFTQNKSTVRDFPLSAVTVSLLYLPRCLRSAITCNKTLTSATTSETLKICCHIIVTL